jgi:hypothetical protein
MQFRQRRRLRRSHSSEAGAAAQADGQISFRSMPHTSIRISSSRGKRRRADGRGGESSPEFDLDGQTVRQLSCDSATWLNPALTAPFIRPVAYRARRVCFFATGSRLDRGQRLSKGGKPCGPQVPPKQLLGFFGGQTLCPPRKSCGFSRSAARIVRCSHPGARGPESDRAPFRKRCRASALPPRFAFHAS